MQRTFTALAAKFIQQNHFLIHYQLLHLGVSLRAGLFAKSFAGVVWLLRQDFGGSPQKDTAAIPNALRYKYKIPIPIAIGTKPQIPILPAQPLRTLQSNHIPKNLCAPCG
ncbi:hypothetical protein D0817_17485 [Flavobacterium cupreum]|uniref:Uncharacterized protein n=1 Tax=Flavobacterium cupreum TaxID=2133766 RepID=A0A434A3L5_9FLAO|nr:hypothetical protein D0817_17485 [Flavobacterium cupreum]